MRKQLYSTIFFLILIVPSSHAQDTLATVGGYIRHLDTTYTQSQEQAFKQLKAYLDRKGEKSMTVEELDEIYYALAKYSSRMFDFENSKHFAKKGIKLLEKHNVTKGKSGYYNLLGGVTYFDNKLDSAAYYFIQSLKALEAEGQNEKLPFINNNIANIYSEQNNPEKALSYFKGAYEQLTVSEETKNSNLLAPITGNLAFTYYQLDSLDKATIYANKALQIGKKYDNLQGAAVAYNVKSSLAKKEGKLDSAYFYLKKAFAIANGQQNNYQIAFTASNLADLLSENNPEEAIEYGEIAYAKNSDGKKGYMLYKNIRTLGKAYFNIGNYKKASEFQKMYIRYQDSLFNSDYNAKTIDILEKYQASLKELKIAEQEAEISVKENQQRILIIIAIALSIVALLGFLFLRQRQKTQKQQIISLENEKENIALKSLMTGEEKERSRIAKELHDGLGGILAAAKMHASKGDNNDKVTELLDTASKESRRISHNLLPESLMKKGLDKALQDFVESMNESGLLKADYQSVNLQEDLPQPLQLSVYRIIQELLNNIIKHSEATEALIQLQQENKKLIVTVEDNGKGFAHKDTSKGIGLQNIESRISLLNGNMEIDSQEKQGTSVYIELELEK